MQGNHFVSMAGSKVQGTFQSFKKKQGVLNVEGNLAEKRIDQSKIFKFDNKASGIVLIKQDYKKLFHNPTKKLQFPIQSVELLFFNKKDTNNEVLKLVIMNGLIKYEYTTTRQNGTQITAFPDPIKVDEVFFPTPQEAPKMLQKKIWIELNRLNRTLYIYTGDVVKYKGQKPLFMHVFKKKQAAHEGWKNQVEKFPVPTYDGKDKGLKIKEVEPFTEIQYFFVKFNVSESQDSKTTRKINDFVTLQVLNLSRIFDPVIEEKASLLKPTLANLESIPGPLRHLYDCLKNLDIRSLPDFNKQSITYEEKDKYLNWKGLQFALHHSLVTPYGYTAQGVPIGIMNHLYKMKCKKLYRQFKPYREGEGNRKFYMNREDILKEIYENRAGYIRLQLLPHEGLGPGSMAVLEIWPPYHCSSIHNHGDAFGLIKVLSGSIRVQNYSQLAFAALDSNPYLQSDYEQCQYTWLSELSFGIHRLVNVMPQTCFTLQAYYHNEVTQEFFSVVKKIEDKLTYIEYYPQNDWVNYLKEYANKDNSEDTQFVRDIVDKYGLFTVKKVGDKEVVSVDTSFQRMVLALKKEYEYYQDQLATKSEPKRAKEAQIEFV